MEQKDGCEDFALESFVYQQKNVCIFHWLPFRLPIHYLLIFFGYLFAKGDCSIVRSDLLEAFGADSLCLVRQFIDLLLDMDEILKRVEKHTVSFEAVVGALEVIGVLFIVLGEKMEIVAQEVH